MCWIHQRSGRGTAFLRAHCPNVLDFFFSSIHHLHLASSFRLMCIHDANDLCWPMCVPFNWGITYFFLLFHIIAQLVSTLLIAIFKQLHHNFSQFNRIFCSPAPYILHPNIISFIEIWVVCWMHYETPHGCIMKAILSSCAQLCSSFAQICHRGRKRGSSFNPWKGVSKPMFMPLSSKED